MIEIHDHGIGPGPARHVDRERCCFCWRFTPFWCEKDVAVCEPCAETHDLSEVPTKKEWWAEFDRRYPRIAIGYHSNP